LVLVCTLVESLTAQLLRLAELVEFGRSGGTVFGCLLAWRIGDDLITYKATMIRSLLDKRVWTTNLGETRVLNLELSLLLFALRESTLSRRPKPRRDLNIRVKFTRQPLKRLLYESA
jgi:hypothetical protein